MNAEQDLRASVELWNGNYPTGTGSPSVQRMAAAVGRLLEPIPAEIEDTAWFTSGPAALTDYRAWLIGGDE